MTKKRMIIHHHDVDRLIQFRFRIINDTARKRVRRNRLGCELLRLAGWCLGAFPGVLFSLLSPAISLFEKGIILRR